MSNKDGKTRERVSAFESSTIILGFILAVLSAVICMQIIGKVGTTPNTSLIGAIVAMVVARIPLQSLMKFKSLERQNYIQTIVSGAGFTAANIGLLSVSILFILGENSFILPMILGALFGCLVSICVVGKIFDSRIYPAEAAWPPGVATAKAIEAGDEGGEKGRRLIQGIVVGIVGSMLKLPVAGIGVAFIANIFAISGLGIGLIIKGYSTTLFGGFDIGATYIPHGIMMGAGGMALIQCLIIIFNKKKEKGNYNVTVSDKDAKKGIFAGFILYIVGAIFIAIISGIISEMSFSKLIIWVLYASVCSVIAMLIVGMACMHSGWFPAFAITTIFLIIGIFIGFPSVPLALLTGYICSVGPCFADMGNDLKAGWILRGMGSDHEYEVYGRKHQVYCELFGAIVGIIVVFVSMNLFFESDLMPPISGVFATTIESSVDPSLIKTLAIWAIPGALIQCIGKTKNMVGVLFATGLLLNNPMYGIGILVAVTFRVIFGNKFMDTRDAGLIVGDGLYGFFSAVIKAIF